MNKVELVAAIAKKSGKKKVEVVEFIDDLLEVMIETFSKGEKISLSNFGNFELIKRKETKERTIYSPLARKEITIPSKNETIKLSFRVAKSLQQKLNN